MSARITTMKALVACLLFATTPACDRRPAEETKQGKKLQQAEAARAARAALLEFADAVRSVLEWKSAHESTGSELERTRVIAEFADKLDAVPVENIPQEVMGPWKRLLAANRALIHAANPDERLREQGSQAAAQLNEALAAHGIVDLHF